jgi:NADH-quinone oxidoreductase subunit L
VFNHAFVGEGTGEFWKGSLVFSEHLIHAMHHVPHWVKWAPFTVMATGLLIAWYAYIKNTKFPAAFVDQFGFLYRFLLNKWYFDELYTSSSSVRQCGWAGCSGRWAISASSIASAPTAPPGWWPRAAARR